MVRLVLSLTKEFNMNDKEILVRLFKIAQKQQKTLEKLAQQQVPQSAPMNGPALAASILEKAKAIFPQIETQLNGPLQVLNLGVAGGVPQITASFASGQHSAELRKAIDTAATQVLGAGKYRLDLTGTF